MVSMCQDAFCGQSLCSDMASSLSASVIQSIGRELYFEVSCVATMSISNVSLAYLPSPGLQVNDRALAKAIDTLKNARVAQRSEKKTTYRT